MPSRRDLLAVGLGFVAGHGGSLGSHGEADTLSDGQTILGIAGQGQSNMVGELNFGQRWRTPDVFDARRDGPAIISKTTTPFAETLSGVGTDRKLATMSLVGLAPETAPYGSDAGSGLKTGSETCVYGFALQLVRHRADIRLCVSVAGAQGASPLSVLRQPTRVEILSGEMITSGSRISVPLTSLERVALARGLSLRDLWQCDATPATAWFRDAWAQSAIHELCRRRGSTYHVAYMPMQHGEALHTEEYRAALTAFYDEKQACWRAITGQQRDALMVMEIPNYSPFLEISGTAGYDHWRERGFASTAAPGGADSRYWTEADRINLLFDRNLDQLSAIRIGGRRIIASHPKYALTSLIHHDQWGDRWAGEIMGFKASQEDFGRQHVSPFTPIELQSANGVARLTFDRPISFQAPAKNVASDELKPGIPYGIALYSAAGGECPITRDDVRIEENGRVIAIRHSLPPDAGLMIDYLRRTRTGSICATQPLPLVMPDRDGTPTERHDYCQPFRMTVKVAPRTP